MLTHDTYQTYLAILKSELVPALGCTEPIAVAYAAAKAAEVLGTRPERAELWCSGNIVKNVKGVVVPKTGGLKGIDAAAIRPSPHIARNREKISIANNGP